MRGSDAAEPSVRRHARNRSAAMDLDAVDVMRAATRAALSVAHRSLSETLAVVPVWQFRALLVLVLDGEMTIRDLADRLDRAVGTTRLVARYLAAAGWIVRASDPEDRRRTVVRATPDGAGIVHAAAEQHRRILASVARELTDQERQSLRDVFAFVAAATTNHSPITDMQLLQRATRSVLA